ncbi:hypothetical protein QBC35DRAFT_457410 [Podospora australis]|uniref:Uncharacterized protein n=1 Tax=Podospora australis TaxID=1536484 RepID=A0AAN6WI85_9PEZI|nr:hypothetical protein QBC35DRAFT_457410 [Podospora australis]
MSSQESVPLKTFDGHMTALMAQGQSLSASRSAPTINVPQVAARRRNAANTFKERTPLTEISYENTEGRGPLSTFDVFALISNKMIDTGIYSAPVSVFSRAASS